MSNQSAVTIEQERPIGRELYEQMIDEFDYSAVTWTMKRYHAEMSQVRADELLDAFLQCLALAPLNSKDRYITMFQTVVDEAFILFIVNT